MKLKIRWKKWLSVAVIAAAVVTAVGVNQFAFTSYAYTQSAGTVKGTGVRVRQSPVNGTTITYLNSGAAVTVIDETTGSDGYVWYQVSFLYNGTTTTGWMRSDYVTITSVGTTTPDDASYVAALQAAGFPESYCSYLVALHNQYPNWQFEAVQTGLDWNTVVEKESEAGKNLVQNTVNDARKSTDTKSYDWNTNTWYIYDGSSWVGASSDFIAYCMDPRNWLNDTYIFQFETLSYADYQNASGVSSILSGTFMSGNYNDSDGTTRSYADTFTEIGRNLGVSPYHLASRCRQEQGTKGTSSLISGTYPGYEGYYNYFNVNAYGSSSTAVIINGLTYAKNQGWNTRYKAIGGGAAVVANNYVNKGQNTIYFEKFNVVNASSGLYSHQYMTNVMGAISEGQSMGKAYTDKNQAFVFRIPVYSNMPASAVTFSDSGNPNNWLSSISVSGYNMTPSFTGATTNYSLVVGEDVSSISVSANAVTSTSSVTGTGDYALNYGNNIITITCTSQSGAARAYTLTVARQGSGETVSVSRGDINQDGKISNADQVMIKQQILGVTSLSGNALVAADINQDGKVSNADLVRLKRHILGIETIQ